MTRGAFLFPEVLGLAKVSFRSGRLWLGEGGNDMSVRSKWFLGAGILATSLLGFAGTGIADHHSAKAPKELPVQEVKKQLVGVWKLVSYEFGTTHPMGRDPVGLLIYGADGHMSLQIMRPDRPKFQTAGGKEGGYDSGTAAEAMSAFRGYIAYFGTYEVDEKGKFVTHHIEGSLFPNWVRRDQIEISKLDDDRLTIGWDPIRYTWKRVR